MLPETEFPNMDYVNAPYEVSFLLAVHVPPAVRAWSRKRRLRWRRRVVRQAVNRQRKRVQGAADGMARAMYRFDLLLRTLPPEHGFKVPILFKRENYRGACED